MCLLRAVHRIRAFLSRPATPENGRVRQVFRLCRMRPPRIQVRCRGVHGHRRSGKRSRSLQEKPHENRCLLISAIFCDQPKENTRQPQQLTIFIIDRLESTSADAATPGRQDRRLFTTYPVMPVRQLVFMRASRTAGAASRQVVRPDHCMPDSTIARSVSGASRIFIVTLRRTRLWCCKAQRSSPGWRAPDGSTPGTAGSRRPMRATGRPRFRYPRRQPSGPSCRQSASPR